MTARNGKGFVLYSKNPNVDLGFLISEQPE
jgi:hypothetical protein